VPESAAAAAAAMAAALSGTVAAQLGEPAAEFDAARRRFGEAVQQHRAALQAVATARAAGEATVTPALEEALKEAALLTLETSERVHHLLVRLEALQREAPLHFVADLAAARALARAAKTSSLACVGGELESLTDAAFLEHVLRRLGAIESE